MNSFFFMSDSSCPVPRPAPELLEIVVKQREGNQNWRAKYIVATKVTRQDKFRQRPHHAVHSCARVWLGEIHTLTAPDGSARWPDSDGEDDGPTPAVGQPMGGLGLGLMGGAIPAAAQPQMQGKGKKGQQSNAALGLKAPQPGQLPIVSPSVAGAAAAAVAAASAAAANESTSSTSGSTQAASSSSSSAPTQANVAFPGVGVPTAATIASEGSSAPQPAPALTLPAMTPQLQQLMMPGWMTPGMTYPASIAQYMPLLTGILTNPHGTANMKDLWSGALALPHHLQGVNRQPRGPFRLPNLPDLLICIRPIEEWGPQRAPVLFVQTHGGQEYLLLKHHATYIIDVAPEHEVVSVRISMKNEKPKTLRLWKFDNSIQRPAIGQGQMDLDDITRSIPQGMIIPVIQPPGSGDSPFHVLHIEKELHPTLPTVVLHQLHEPQHLHTEQTFFITPLAKGQRKVKKILLPPPPSKPSSNKQQQIHAAAAGVISAIATGGNVSEASATLAATKLKKRAGGKKGKDEPAFLPPQPMPALSGGQVVVPATPATAMMVGTPSAISQQALAHVVLPSQRAGVIGMPSQHSQSSHQQQQQQLHLQHHDGGGGSGDESGMDGGSSDESEAAGLDGLGRKRKRKHHSGVPPSIAARLKPHMPGIFPMHGGEGFPDSVSGNNGGGLMSRVDPQQLQEYFQNLYKNKQGQSSSPHANGGDYEDEEVSDAGDEDNDDPDSQHHDGQQQFTARRRRKKARLQSDISIGPNPSLQAFITAHDSKLLTKAARLIWSEIKKHPDYIPQAYTKEQAATIAQAQQGKDDQQQHQHHSKRQMAAAQAAAPANGRGDKMIQVLQPGQIPVYMNIPIDWMKLTKMLGEVVTSGDLQNLWKYTVDHMLARKVIDLDELDLRSLWNKPLDSDTLAARIRAGAVKPMHQQQQVQQATPAAFPFPMFPFPMFPGGPAGGMKFPFPFPLGVGGVGAKPSSEQQDAMVKAAGANPLLANLMNLNAMLPMGGMNAAAAAGIAQAHQTNPAGENWMNNVFKNNIFNPSNGQDQDKMHE